MSLVHSSNYKSSIHMPIRLYSSVLWEVSSSFWNLENCSNHSNPHQNAPCYCKLFYMLILPRTPTLKHFQLLMCMQSHHSRFTHAAPLLGSPSWSPPHWFSEGPLLPHITFCFLYGIHLYYNHWFPSLSPHLDSALLQHSCCTNSVILKYSTKYRLNTSIKTGGRRNQNGK